MRPFRYVAPTALNDVTALLGEHGTAAHVLAGGTDLLVRLRSGHVTPDIVVDIKRVLALTADVIETNGCLRIGARATMSRLITDAKVRQHFPALVEAAKVVGSVQIRNRATLVGNLCNASPAADTAPVLLVHNAILNVVGAGHQRRVNLNEFFVGPGRTVLNRDELIESVDLPLSDVGTSTAFGRITRRQGVDLASVTVCCLVTPSGETRFGYGAVAPTPIIVSDESGLLARSRAASLEGASILQRLVNIASPISDVRASREYRLGMLSVMSRRTLQAALDQRPVQ